MPTYEYACPKCGHSFELFQSIKDEHLKKCPKCKKTGVKRVGRLRRRPDLKGTGFYITDYKKSPGKKEPNEVKPAAESSPKPPSTVKT